MKLTFRHIFKNWWGKCNNLKLFQSPRFWGLIAVGILQALVLFNVIDSVQGEGLTSIVQAIIVGAVAIRTIDKASEPK